MSKRPRTISPAAAHRSVTTARVYHQDGACFSAARVLRSLIADLSKDADAYEAEGQRRYEALQDLMRKRASQ